MREQHTTLSLEKAAALLQWSAATLSRTENGKRHIEVEEVASALAVYQVPVKLRNALIRRANAIGEEGWWSRPIPGVRENTGGLASYEADANVVTDWSISLIPGLLQTYEYAVAFMLAAGASREDSETSWMARLRRSRSYPNSTTPHSSARPHSGSRLVAQRSSTS